MPQVREVQHARNDTGSTCIRWRQELRDEVDGVTCDL